MRHHEIDRYRIRRIIKYPKQKEEKHESRKEKGLEKVKTLSL